MNQARKYASVDELYGELEMGVGDKSWTVARTKSRCEKKLARYAKQHHIHYYLPQRVSERVYEKSKVSFNIPLFTGYLFVCVDYDGKRILESTGLSAGFLKVRSEEQLLSELKSLHMIPVKKEKAGPEYWLSKGLKVQIVSGPLAGSKGVVESHDKLQELRLQVNILRQAVLVKVNPEDVEIIGEFEISEIED